MVRRFYAKQKGHALMVAGSGLVSVTAVTAVLADLHLTVAVAVACVVLAFLCGVLLRQQGAGVATNPPGPTPILFVAEDAGTATRSNGAPDHRLAIGAAGSAKPADAVETARKLGVGQLCVHLPFAGYDEKRTLLTKATAAGLTLMVMEGNGAGGEAPARLRRMRIDDLFHREFDELEQSGVRDLIDGKVVMVTGAGGSIGSELCRQIARHQPSLLVLLEQSEYALYSIEQALGDAFPHLAVVAAVADVKSALRVGQIVRRYEPAVIFHAAAYKHVPLMEDINAWEAIRNNVFGTYVVAQAAIDTGVEKFVLVSTDKAVNPTNVMGASKRLAEMVCQALQQTTPIPKFEMVRFGNVLGSAGSVIPRFDEQIARGGPVTVTHPDMVRYFMSIPEAANLVLQAGSMGLGGEVFVMDMGKPIRILDLAKDMIRLATGRENGVAVEFSGLRPGEKLFEELLADDEHTRPTPHPRLRIAKAREMPPDWLPGLVEWVNSEQGPDEATLRRDLKRWVPDYVSAVRPKFRAIDGGQLHAG